MQIGAHLKYENLEKTFETYFKLSRGKYSALRDEIQKLDAVFTLH